MSGGPLPVAIELARPPSVAAVFGRGLLRALARRQGRASTAQLAELPPMSARVGGVAIDLARVALYREVCGVEDHSDVLPPAYPEALFLGLMGSLVTHRAFPLSPLGLIHVRQTIEQRAPIRARERLDLTCRLAGTRASDRGVELDWRMEVEVGGELRWEGVATVLSRNRVGHGRAGTPPAGDGAGRLDGLAELEVPEPTGRRFARASGDFNPHHLWTFTARPLGYRRPIAHGMWTLARLLAELERGAPPHRTVCADVAFKQPIALPSRVRLLAARGAATDAAGERLVEVRPANGDGLHLVGRVALGR